MSLWTPDGEVPVGRRAATPSSSSTGPADGPASGASPEAGGADGVAAMLGAPSLDELSPEERARAEEMIAQMAEVQRQVLSAPAEQFVVNHVVGLYELAAIHLGQPEPDVDAARLAIDAMAGVLDATEARLGPDAGQLRDALTQLQMAFVQMTAGPGA